MSASTSRIIERGEWNRLAEMVEWFEDKHPEGTFPITRCERFFKLASEFEFDWEMSVSMDMNHDREGF